MGPLGCGLDSSSSASSVTGEGDEAGGRGEACKLENAQIGQVGVTIDLGSTRVVIDSWVRKDGEPGEYVGFTFHTTSGAGVRYVVKAGGERYPAEATTWMHPRGTGGPEVSAISNVDFCESCDDPDGCDGEGGEGGDGEGGASCPDPDGCDPGTGEGGAGEGGDGGGEPTPPADGSCQVDSDCATNELCQDGRCVAVVE
jgi:hypothetical protein